ncbi:nucleotide exchange factor GrpE [Kushneria indalinina]|uniref:Protein GrpE n=1 Tax=Kushneria indalinina DSM 14324 TaxID=1122140 RepID=A0A3D9DSP7_9GAMM|nr:nucleotide exchange factor GrpE [Kushneria indalinina]REC93434.1 molecular chaperone GrpE [Kushneria indalinina DSM 14324]
MTNKPHNPKDEELERAEREGEPQPFDADNTNTLEDIEGVLQADDEETLSPSDQEADVLAGRVAELEQELAEAKDQQVRAAAEAQNARRRAEQDADKAKKFALEKFVKELLPVVDSLEKGLESMSEDVSETHREGVSMTLKMQLDVLSKFGVEQIDPHGEPFDPQYHEAMTQVANPEMDPNTVMEVMQKGYTLNGRLVRPAMVVVSKQA